MAHFFLCLVSNIIPIKFINVSVSISQSSESQKNEENKTNFDFIFAIKPILKFLNASIFRSLSRSLALLTEL